MFSSRTLRRRKEKKLKKHAEKTKDFLVECRRKILPTLISSFNGMNKTYPCKQFQLIIMDLESITEHLNDLKKNGAKAPMSVTPLKDSKVKMNPETDLPKNLRDQKVEPSSL